MSYASYFAAPIDDCNQILNAGSLLLVKDIICPNEEPTVTTLTTTIAGVIGDTTLTMTANAGVTGIRLRKGSILYFGANKAVVTVETIVLPTATAVPVESLVAAIPVAATASTWGLLQILSTTNLPINLTSQKSDRTDHSFGLRGTMVKTKLELAPQVTVINNLNDRALYEYVFNSATSNKELFAMIVRSSTIHSWGRALIDGWNDDGAVADFSKPQFTIDYQGEWALTGAFKYLPTASQTQLNTVRKLAGLSILA